MLHVGEGGGGGGTQPLLKQQSRSLGSTPTTRPGRPGQEVGSWRDARAVLPPGGLLWRKRCSHRRSPAGGSQPFLPNPPRQPAQPARDTRCPVLGLGFPAGPGHALPTPEPSPGPRWPRRGSGSQPWRPRPWPRTAPTVPSPSSPWLPAGSGERVRAKRRRQPGAGPATKLKFPSLKPYLA
uniref:Uncharacterized protein n=1 Tax=Mustela putorius furo TaxID=9669 RepID=M3YB01_MUSPF